MIQFFRRRPPKDQADRLRSLAREAGVEPESSTSADPYAGPSMIAVAGSKGGVGATTLTVELAKAIGRFGRRAVAVDANLRQADLVHMAGASPQSGHNIVDVITGRCSAHEALVTTTGLSVLPGAWAPDAHSETTSQGVQSLLHHLESLQGVADVLVVDTGSGHSPATAPLWNAADQVLLVGAPDRMAIIDAYAAIKLSRSQGDRPKTQLLINRVEDQAQADRVHSRIAETCLRFLGGSVPLAGWVAEGDIETRLTLLAAKLAKGLPKPNPSSINAAPIAA